MRIRITRRDFLKLAGAGGAALWGAASGRTPRIAFRGGLFPEPSGSESLPQNPNRFQGPGQRMRRGYEPLQPLVWEDGISLVAEVFQKYAPHEIAFLLGNFPDHLAHLVRLIAQALGGAGVYRFGLPSELDCRVTLMDAARRLFGSPGPPVFDLSKADVLFSFGAGFSESWLADEAGTTGWKDGGIRPLLSPHTYLVQLEPRRSPVAAGADEWIPIRPGSEALLARALAHLMQPSGDVSALDLRLAAAEIGIPLRELNRLARLFLHAPRRLAIPGGAALGTRDGLLAAQWILDLNLIGREPGLETGLYLPPGSPLFPGAPDRPATAAELNGLAVNLRLGRVKALLIHGVDPLSILPRLYGFEQALRQAGQVIVFSSAPDATTAFADAILPDHDRSESQGYQLSLSGADLGAVVAIQAQTPPRYDTRATADVLLSAVRRIGGQLASVIDYKDEQDFLLRSLSVLSSRGGVFRTKDPAAFWQIWEGQSGWRRARPARFHPVSFLPPSASLPGEFNLPANGLPEKALRLLIFPADRYPEAEPASVQPAELHPLTAARLGLGGGDWIRVTSVYASAYMQVCLNPHLHPDALAVPWWGYRLVPSPALNIMKEPHPLDLLGMSQNDSGELAVSGIPVQVERVDRPRS